MNATVRKGKHGSVEQAKQEVAAERTRAKCYSRQGRSRRRSRKGVEERGKLVKRRCRLKVSQVV